MGVGLDELPLKGVHLIMSGVNLPEFRDYYMCINKMIGARAHRSNMVYFDDSWKANLVACID
jgi:hypothetical protein